MPFFKGSRLFALLVGSVLLYSEIRAAGPAGLRLATFTCDVTPPMGHPLCGGWIKPVEGVDDPELAKGVVLMNSGGTYVLCAVDWCELRDGAYDLFREEIARGAGTTPSRVAVQTTHVHNAPITDREAQLLLDKEKDAPKHADLDFLASAARRTGEAAKAALAKARPVTQIGTGMAKVDKFASARRVPGPNGSILVRYSVTPDLKVREAPEGLIDPMLRTIAFYEGEKPIACLHYYATHPQSYYGDGRPTWDTVGIARERLEKETGAFQVYFTGCGGNVTAGKYNDGSPKARRDLAERLHDAMTRSVASLERHPVAPIIWKTRPVTFELRKEPAYEADTLRKTMQDPKASEQSRLMAALGLSWDARVKSGQPIELSCLAIGDVRILHLPGEPFVEFQLEAQKLAPKSFVAVAGYGDAATGYICLEKAYAEGGYEPTASNIAPSSERILKEGIAGLLKDTASN